MAPSSAPSSQDGTSSCFKINCTSKSNSALGEKAEQAARAVVGSTVRQKIQILSEVKGPSYTRTAGLLIPNLIAHHRSEPHLFRRAESFVETALRFLVELEPAAGELFDLDRKSEIVANNLA